MTFSFEAPLPPKVLSSNSRTHWKAQLKAKALSRSEGEALAAHTVKRFREIFGDEKAPPVLLIADAFPAQRGHLGGRCCPVDPSNGVSVLKAFQDGLAKGWGIDDRNFQVVWFRLQRTSSCPRPGRLEITVKRWEE